MLNWEPHDAPATDRTQRGCEETPLLTLNIHGRSQSTRWPLFMARINYADLHSVTHDMLKTHTDGEYGNKF